MEQILSPVLFDEPVKQVIAELRANDNVIALILFGSVARGEAREYSDIDLAIIAREGISEPEVHDLLSYGSKKIDVSLFSALPLAIRFRVIRDGTVVFCKDPIRLHRTKTDTIREYLDAAPFIRKHCRHAMGILR